MNNLLSFCVCVFFSVCRSQHRLLVAIRWLNNRAHTSVSINGKQIDEIAPVKFTALSMRKKSIFVDFFICFFSFSGIASGRGYAHGEVGIAHIDIESVRRLQWHSSLEIISFEHIRHWILLISFFFLLLLLHFRFYFVACKASGKIDSVKWWSLVYGAVNENTHNRSVPNYCTEHNLRCETRNGRWQIGQIYSTGIPKIATHQDTTATF